METPTHSKPPKTYASCLNLMFLLPFLMPLVCETGGDSPHAPKQLTWQISSQTGEVVWSTTGLHTPGTWWPTLTPDFCQLAAGLDNWDIPTEDPHSLKRYAESRPQQMTAPGCSSPTARCRLAQSDFYVCPQDGRDRATAYRCGGYEEYFCSQLGCETTGDAYWNPSSSWDLITVRRNYTKPAAGGHTCFHQNGWRGQQQPLSLPLNITFNSQHKTDYTPWLAGKTWGLRWHIPGRDKGVILKIRLKIESPPTQSVGPDSVLSEQGSSRKKESPPVLSLLQQRNIIAHTLGQPLTTPAPHAEDRLLNLVNGAFSALNNTNPDATDTCWLCLATNPPYYEGLAVLGNFTNTTNASLCTQPIIHHLTLPQVRGQGTCIGTVPDSHQTLCNKTHFLSSGAYYLYPEKGTWWACSTGLTPCISAQVLNNSGDYCVMVQVMPRILYYPSATLKEKYEGRTRSKREPVSLTLAEMLGLGVAAGVRNGMATMIQGGQQIDELQMAIDTDLKATGQSVTMLEKSLTSPSEIVLQNRRRLDMLSLKDKGLCAALGEECCFYVDHTGIVRDSMAKLRKRLDEREKYWEAQSWFDKSPWMTPLISTIIVFIILTLGLCIFSRLLQFIKERLSIA